MATVNADVEQEKNNKIKSILWLIPVQVYIEVFNVC